MKFAQQTPIGDLLKRFEGIKIIRSPKQPRLTEPTKDEIWNMLKNKICMSCGKPLKKDLKGNYYCYRDRTDCHIFIQAKTIKKYE